MNEKIEPRIINKAGANSAGILGVAMGIAEIILPGFQVVPDLVPPVFYFTSIALPEGQKDVKGLMAACLVRIGLAYSVRYGTVEMLNVVLPAIEAYLR